MKLQLSNVTLPPLCDKICLEAPVVLKVKFKSPFWQEPDLGYYEIEELVKNNNFDSFARQYCFYLGDVEYDEGYTDYYEIVWDYRTYYETILSYNGIITPKQPQKVRKLRKPDNKQNN